MRLRHADPADQSDQRSSEQRLGNTTICLYVSAASDGGNPVFWWVERSARNIKKSWAREEATETVWREIEVCDRHLFRADRRRNGSSSIAGILRRLRRVFNLTGMDTDDHLVRALTRSGTDTPFNPGHSVGASAMWQRESGVASALKCYFTGRHRCHRPALRPYP
jgi:hypothetical protein